MERKKQFSLPDDEEETIVTPRFDGEEERTARPVVPLAVVSGEAEVYERQGQATYRSTPSWRRNSWPFLLVFFSAVAGSIAGGTGLYIYQSREPAAAARSSIVQPETPQTQSPEQTQAPEPSPTPEEAAAIFAPTPEPEPVEVDGSYGTEEENDDSERSRPLKRAGESLSKPDVIREGPLKHGKKGEGPTLRPRRVNDDSTEMSPADTSEEDDNEARRIDTYTYPRSRRWERRNRRQQQVDRVRGIFEGQPEEKP